jgi:bacterioferritin-associated ferredoxin
MKTNSSKKNIIICRCQDITLEEIENIVISGITNPEEIKRILHAGMGPCQGRTCGQLISRIITEIIKKPASEIMSTNQRPPLVPVPIKAFLGAEDE